jgi:hypothetical protein
MQGHNKWICGFKCTGHRSHTYIHITAEDQAGPWCTQLQILDLPALELNPLNSHIYIFLIFRQPKGCFPLDRQKVSQCTLYIYIF